MTLKKTWENFKTHCQPILLSCDHIKIWFSMQASTLDAFPKWLYWEGCSRKGSQRKNGGDDGGGLLISPNGVACSRIVGVSASVIFPLHHKTQKMFLLVPAHMGSPGQKGP